MSASKLDSETFRIQWRHETSKICKIQTYRGPELDNREVNGRLLQVRDYLFGLAAAFNDEVTTTKFRPFQWCGYKKEGSEDLDYNRNPSDRQCKNADYWVMGLRFGSDTPENRVALICHLDTVPATAGDSWRPFHPHVEERTYDYEGSDIPSQDFLVGRGCVDDKGPAISAFIAARTLAKQFDGSALVEKTMFELIFDTSEETDMSFPHYIEDPATNKPDFGVVYDAMWVVRAEKGCERPVFSVPKGSPPSTGIYIESLLSAPNNSTNTIPDWATAVITGDPTELGEFAKNVQDDYESFVFDDPSYNAAPLSCTPNNASGAITSVTLQTTIKGAQHGSAPQENRSKGANPLVSLANYLAGKVKAGTIMSNDYGTIVDFIYWMFGTRVFGENHKDLYQFDDVFTKGNGTTYAVTKVSEDAATAQIKLEVDIRYAVPHHENGWDHVTEGLLPGILSIFGDREDVQGLFPKLVGEYNDGAGSNHGTVSCFTQTMFGPDIRTPDKNEHFKIVEKAYKEVRGVDPVRFAIGGGTDAKGYTFLLGVGPLFCVDMGPPINYHGIDEGAPMHDMFMSTQTLIHVFTKEIRNPPAKLSIANKLKSIDDVKNLRRNGHIHRCSC